MTVLAAALLAAWLSDDGLVTLRTIENLASGDGFRWNLAERTQTATHPLWILLMGLARWLTGELYVTTIVVSLLCTTLAAWRIARRSRALATAIAVVPVALLCSRTGVEFATGGLENPLVYLLAALFADAWFDEDAARPDRLRRLGLLGALLVMARIDLVLLFAPCVVAAMSGVAWRKALRALLPGIAILAAWTLFALLYFGTVIPTPGYGKALALDIPPGELALQGLRYLGDLGWRDPATAIVLLAAVGAAIAHRQTRFVAPAIGLLLQLAYTLKIGGDFMAGRFFSAALLFALAVLARGVPGRLAPWLAGQLVLATLLVAPGLPPWLDLSPPQSAARMHHGIADERSYYAEMLAMWSDARHWPRYGEFVEPLVAAGRTEPMVAVFHAVGDPCMRAGPLVHMVEPYICDPLLTRLPIEDPAHWRVGHFKRRIPEGYLETLASGDNQIHHAGLRDYYEALRTVIRAPVLDPDRLAVMWRLWRGEFDAGLRRFVDEEYRAPPLVEVDAARFDAAVAPGTFWFDVDCVVVREGGVRVRLGAPLAAEALGLTVDGSGAGVVRFLRDGAAVGEAPLTVQGFGAQRLQVPVPLAARGYDAFEIHLEHPGQRDAEHAAVSILPVFALLALD